MAAIVKVCLRDSQKRQSHQCRPKRELAEWCAHDVCVCSGGSKDETCQQFFFRVPISIYIFFIPHKQQRKEGDARTKTKLTREQWWREGSFSGAKIS